MNTDCSVRPDSNRAPAEGHTPSGLGGRAVSYVLGPGSSIVMAGDPAQRGFALFWSWYYNKRVRAEYSRPKQVSLGAGNAFFPEFGERSISA